MAVAVYLYRRHADPASIRLAAAAVPRSAAVEIRAYFVHFTALRRRKDSTPPPAWAFRPGDDDDVSAVPGAGCAGVGGGYPRAGVVARPPA